MSVGANFWLEGVQVFSRKVWANFLPFLNVISPNKKLNLKKEIYQPQQEVKPKERNCPHVVGAKFAFTICGAKFFNSFQGEASHLLYLPAIWRRIQTYLPKLLPNPFGGSTYGLKKQNKDLIYIDKEIQFLPPPRPPPPPPIFIYNRQTNSTTLDLIWFSLK